ncbi:MAG: glycosyltransferase family 2 protein [Candidatus Aquicultorales bacterium]
MRDSCSVVIRCFNEEEHIGKLLSGLLQQTAKDIEIIVVDSGSTDATVSIASQFPIKLIQISPEEFSFGRALNIGCEAATGDSIVLASAHVYPVYDTWIEHLVAPLSDPKVGIVYGKQRGNEKTRFSEHQIFARWFPDTSVKHQDHPFCNNANAAVKRTVWEQIRYNEELTGLEDLDWAKRAMDAGFRVSYAQDAVVVHIHSETPRRILNRYRREAIALKQILPHEKFSFFDFTRLSFANIVSDYYHALKGRTLSKTLIEIPVFRLMQFWGTYRGFAQRGPVSGQLRERFYYPGDIERHAPRKTADGKEIDYSDAKTEHAHEPN